MVMSPIDTLIPKLSWEFMGLEDGGKGKKVCLVSYVQKRIGIDHVSRLKQTNIEEIILLKLTLLLLI